MEHTILFHKISTKIFLSPVKQAKDKLYRENVRTIQ